MLPSIVSRRICCLVFLTLVSCASVLAQNTPPRLTGVVIDPIAEGSYANLRARIVDPNAGNRFVLTVNWGDNTAIDRINYPAGTTNFSIFHLYSDNTSSNTYRVAITIADNAGGSRNTNKFVTVTNVAPAATDVTITPAIDEHAPPTLRGTAIQEFLVPTTNAVPNAIVLGPDGALWFTETVGQKIGRVTTNGAFTEYVVPTGTNLQGITVGPDGALWFCVQDWARIGRITTNGSITLFPLTAGRRPQNITTGPDGALWATIHIGGRLARMTTNGNVTETQLQLGATPLGIVTGPDNNLWYTDFYFDWIVRTTTANERTNWTLPYLASPTLITVGPDNALWFTEGGGDLQPGAIARITTNGIISRVSLGLGTSPYGITVGPDNALWFTESFSNKVGRLTRDGALQRFSLPVNSRPLSIVRGPDDALWFTEAYRNRIGRLGFTTSGNVLLSGTFGDPGFGDGHTLTINWGDGTAPQVVTFPPGIVSFNIAHHYTNSGPSNLVSVIIADDDSTQSATNLDVNVVRSRLTSIQRQTNGSLTLQATVVPGATYAVQASPDLQSWLTLSNVTANTNGALQFQDSTAGVPTNRFFRLRR